MMTSSLCTDSTTALGSIGAWKTLPWWSHVEVYNMPTQILLATMLATKPFLFHFSATKAVMPNAANWLFDTHYTFPPKARRVSCRIFLMLHWFADVLGKSLSWQVTARNNMWTLSCRSKHSLASAKLASRIISTLVSLTKRPRELTCKAAWCEGL